MIALPLSPPSTPSSASPTPTTSRRTSVLVRRELSSGESQCRDLITKAGSARTCWLLVQAAVSTLRRRWIPPLERHHWQPNKLAVPIPNRIREAGSDTGATA